MFRFAHAAGTVVVTIALLSGCSLIGGPQSPTTAEPSPTAEAEGQTVKEACDAILPVLLETNERLNTAYAELQADPAAAGPLLKEISTDLREVAETLENEEVAGLMTAATDSLDAMIVEIDKALAGQPDQAALLETANRVRDDFSAIDPVCQEATAG